VPDFLTRLLHKSRPLSDGVRPRLPSRFEPVSDPFEPAVTSEGVRLPERRSAEGGEAPSPQGIPAAAGERFPRAWPEGSHSRAAAADADRPAEQDPLAGRPEGRVGRRSPRVHPPPLPGGGHQGPREGTAGGGEIHAGPRPQATLERLPHREGRSGPRPAPASRPDVAARKPALRASDGPIRAADVPAPPADAAPVPRDGSTGPTPSSGLPHLLEEGSDGVSPPETLADRQAKALQPVRPVDARVLGRGWPHVGQSSPSGAAPPSDPGPDVASGPPAAAQEPRQDAGPQDGGRRQGATAQRTAASVPGVDEPAVSQGRVPPGARLRAPSSDGRGLGVRGRRSNGDSAASTPRGGRDSATDGWRPGRSPRAPGFGPPLRPLQPPQVPRDGRPGGREDTTVHISIGRIEVRAMTPAAPTVKSRSTPKVMTLEAYLRGKEGGRR
jgi:hypothetical protein